MLKVKLSEIGWYHPAEGSDGREFFIILKGAAVHREQERFEGEPRLEVTIREGVAHDVIAARHMQSISWRATYPNEAAGVSEEWVSERTSNWLKPESLEASVGRLDAIIKDPAQFYRVAEAQGEIVGFVHVSTKEDTSKYIEAVYTNPNVFGKGVGKKLMDAAIEWMGDTPATLEVVTYNERAKKFYAKYGFHEIPGSEALFAETMPTILMIREGEKR